MTEDEWVRAVAEEDLWQLLAPLGRRKRRLLASALIRSLGRWAAAPAITAALEASDRFADTGKRKGALRRAGITLYEDMLKHLRSLVADPNGLAERAGQTGAFSAAIELCAETLPGATVREAVSALQDAESISEADARRRLYPVYREVAGPTPPVAFAPDWRTSAAVQLARQMYDARDFAVMPILADALQDAGCEHPDVLAHCRDPQQVHVRGCWVVDLVLGKN